MITHNHTDDFQASALQLNGYSVSASSKRTMVRKFLCDQMLKVKERPEQKFDKCLTVDGSNRQNLLKSFSCKQMRSFHLALTVPYDDSDARLRALEPRVVAIEGMSRYTSPAVLVAAISGGALEKVVYQEEFGLLEAHFLAAPSASKFWKSCQNGRFCVHGRTLRVLWAALQAPVPPLPPYIREEIEEYGASRVIVLSKPVLSKKKDFGRKRYPCAEENFLRDLNLEAIKWDFVQYGGIVEVCPVVSSRLSVSIQFSDIRSAILAVNTLRQKSLLIYYKYREWSHKYDRDVTNRPCMG